MTPLVVSMGIQPQGHTFTFANSTSINVNKQKMEEARNKGEPVRITVM